MLLLNENEQQCTMLAAAASCHIDVGDEQYIQAINTSGEKGRRMFIRCNQDLRFVIQALLPHE